MGPVAPNRVFKNKRLAVVWWRPRNNSKPEVVKVDVERNVILIKGNIRSEKSLITIKSAVKAK